MAATTKIILAEQVMTLLKGGDASASTSIEQDVIIKLIEQLINSNLKTDFFNTHLAFGETIPDGLVLATYEKIAVEKYKKGFSRAKLPAIPISLPKNMGVYFVGPHIPNEMLASNVITATVISATQINLSWTAITNATSYYLERATDAAFSQNLTPLYSGSLLVFNNLNLTTQTNYWYRVTGISASYNDSIFSNTTATTL